MNVFLNYFLAFYLGYGHVGLALGSSIAAIVSVVIYYLILSRNSFIEVTKESLISIIKILSANIVFYLVINFFANNISAINDQWLSNLVLLFGILFLIIFYFLILYLLGFRASFFRR
jgi:putative peptidoglycan lipid II flippase